MLTGLATALAVFGRVLIGVAFVVSAIRDFNSYQAHAAFMESRRVPYARLALTAGLLLEGVCGALLVVGLWTAPAAIGLIVFMAIVVYVYHNPFDYEPGERNEHLNTITTSAMVVGGLVLLLATVI
jgi:putative oxidoreductase